MTEHDWTYDRVKYGTDNGSDWDWEDDERITTQVIEPDHPLFAPISQLVHKRTAYQPHTATLYLVTHGKWVGYSEYTIEETWDEVHVHQGDADLHWDDMGAFLTDLAEANPPTQG